MNIRKGISSWRGIVWLRSMLQRQHHHCPFANSKLDSVEKHPDEWITELESLEEWYGWYSTKMSDMDFMIHVLSNLPEVYDVVLDGMEGRLMLKDGDSQNLTIEDVRDKLNNWYERIDERERIGMNTEVALTAFKGNCYKWGKVNTDIVEENVRRKMITKEVQLGAMLLLW